MLKKTFIVLLFIFSFTTSQMNLFAQNDDVEMADLMRSNGKIYVVVGVVTVVLSGLLIFLLILDKRVRKLEKSKGKE